MVRALNAYFTLDYFFSNRVITNLINAITSLYQYEWLRSDIVTLLQGG
jgi:hypothetical protein